MFNQRCLLVEAGDRRYFTRSDYLPLLAEFARTFDAAISVVRYSGPLLEIEELAAALCDPDYRNPMGEYEYVSSPIRHLHPRQPTLQRAKEIQDYILDQFLKGKVVALRDLKTRYASQRLTDSCLSQHIKRAMQTLGMKGHAFEKVGAGKYRACGTTVR